AVKSYAEFASKHELETAESRAPARLPRYEAAVARGDSHVGVLLRREQVHRREEKQVARNQIERHPYAGGEAPAGGNRRGQSAGLAGKRRVRILVRRGSVATHA